MLQQMANSINPRLQMTVDYPSGNPVGKMSVLDFKCCMDPQGTVMYTFYRKPMCQPTTITAMSELPWGSKRRGPHSGGDPDTQQVPQGSTLGAEKLPTSPSSLQGWQTVDLTRLIDQR